MGVILANVYRRSAEAQAAKLLATPFILALRSLIACTSAEGVCMEGHRRGAVSMAMRLGGHRPHALAISRRYFSTVCVNAIRVAGICVILNSSDRTSKCERTAA